MVDLQAEDEVQVDCSFVDEESMDWEELIISISLGKLNYFHVHHSIYHIEIPEAPTWWWVTCPGIEYCDVMTCSPGL
jgi:hypothetical protein